MINKLKILIILGLTACAKTGSQGLTGAVGANAPTIPVLTQPAAPTQCANGGSVVTVGTTVSIICNGLNGNTGATGAQGPAGINSTPISVVEFCPGVTPSYPSTFPEYGLCIEDTLYGVYSTNGGFIALLPPGGYNSNAVGSNCNFTILSHCQVQ